MEDFDPALMTYTLRAEVLSNAVETKDLFKGRTRKGIENPAKRVLATPGKGFGHSGEKVHVTVHITKQEWCARPLTGAPCHRPYAPRGIHVEG